jgi:hypothetical protein
LPVERDTEYGVIEELPRASQPEAAMKVRERNAERRRLAVMDGGAAQGTRHDN